MNRYRPSADLRIATGRKWPEPEAEAGKIKRFFEGAAVFVVVLFIGAGLISMTYVVAAVWRAYHPESATQGITIMPGETRTFRFDIPIPVPPPPAEERT